MDILHEVRRRRNSPSGRKPLAERVADNLRGQGLDASYCESMVHDSDFSYMQRQHTLGKFLFNGKLGFFDSLNAKGMELLNNRRPKILFGNHLSQADYMAIWFAHMDSGIKPPRFVASATLDHPNILGLLGMNFRKDGCIFVDRDLLNDRNTGHKTKAAYHETLRQTFREILKDGESIFVFPEGGRAYKQNREGPCQKMKKPIFKMLAGFAKEGLDVDVGCIGCDYDTRIEERAFPILEMCRGRDSMLKLAGYYVADAAAMLSWPVRRHLPPSRDGCYLLAGRPQPLQEIVSLEGGVEKWESIQNHVRDEIRSLYGQIQERKNN